ncbi:MAG: CDP-2,3-bis-(O-geranylgeranyl)-sn-glycerol synthase [Candidatus Marsarchaeota archaeon]|nr:CDP-2,3-bis-(O-geranylgeranyl)-sn-glycerol synthase [Candidatus Marsarchaeota archaeon]
MDWQQILYSVIIFPIIYIFPAYVANGSPVIFGGGAPIDFGRKFRGKPIFGKHKTIRGFVFGLASGIIIGALESVAFPYLLAIGIALSFGTLLGDMLGSFIKRQMGHREGKDIFLMDQYMFFVVALLFAFPLGHIPDVYGILFLIILTGVLHRLTNLLAHKARLKEVPW